MAFVVLVCGFLSTRKPGNVAFNVFFEKWFKEIFFPQMSERLKTELQERAKRTDAGVFDFVRDQAAGWLLGKTTGVRAKLAWNLFQSTMSPSFNDFFFCRTSSVNMGTPEQPSFVVFVGINGEWYLSPHMKLDFDNVSVLRMLDESSR